MTARRLLIAAAVSGWLAAAVAWYRWRDSAWDQGYRFGYSEGVADERAQMGVA